MNASFGRQRSDFVEGLLAYRNALLAFSFWHLITLSLVVNTLLSVPEMTVSLTYCAFVCPVSLC